MYDVKKRASRSPQNPQYRTPASETGAALSNSFLTAALVPEEQRSDYLRPELSARFQPALARSAAQRQLPAAEREADRLSAGIGTGASPSSVKTVMGQRLGADFSAVQFHTGAAAAGRADAMGARAFTSGGDVFFGSGGFDPAIAAHELVHTVQQGAVSGGVETVSAPAMSAQMWPWSKKKKLTPEEQQKRLEQQKARSEAVDNVLDYAGALPGRANEVTDKMSSVLEDEKVAAALTKARGKAAAEKLSGSTEAVKAGSGLVTNSLGTVGSINSLISDARELREARDTGSKKAVRDKQFELSGNAMELGGNLSGMAESGFGLARFFTGPGASATLEAGGNILGKVGGGFGLGGSLVGMGKAAYDLKTSRDIQKKMRAGAKRLETSQGPLTRNQDLMRKVYSQGAGKAHIDKIQAGFDLASSTIDAAGNGAGLALEGVPGVAASLGAGLASSAVSGVGKLVNDVETSRFHKRTVDEELGLEQEISDIRSDDSYKDFRISPEFYQSAILRREGAASGEIGEMFNKISGDRADAVMELAGQGDEEAKRFAKAAKVNLKRKKAREGIYEALGGTDEEYEDLFADSFADKAARHQRIQAAGGYGKYAWDRTKTGAGKAWDAVKAAPGKAWDRVKTGAGSAVGAVKDFATKKETRDKVWNSVKAVPGKAWGAVKSGAGKAWDKTKTGAGRAWKAAKEAPGKAWNRVKTGVGSAAGAVKDFATKKETRQKAWDAVKAAPGKAWNRVKTGAGDAVKYLGEMVTTQTDKVKDWYTGGLEQYNMNRDSYKKMSWFDRAGWTMKNLPARVMAGTKRGQEAADARLAARLQAQEILEDRDFRKKSGEMADWVEEVFG